MGITLATILTNGLLIYLGIGMLFGLVFLRLGVGKIDPAAAQGSWGFKIIIFPGVMLLWPILLQRWRTGMTHPPQEQTPHCRAAQ